MIITSPTVLKARKAVSLIVVTKWALIAVNILASMGYLLAGIDLAQSVGTWSLEGGYREIQNPLATPLIITGIVSLTFGTLLIAAAGAFAQHLLATNTELLHRQTELPGSLISPIRDRTGTTAAATVTAQMYGGGAGK